MNKEWVLLIVALIWGAYAITVGSMAIVYGYVSDLVWISIIAAISGTTGAHVALSVSQKGLSLQTSGKTPETQTKQG